MYHVTNSDLSAVPTDMLERIVSWHEREAKIAAKRGWKRDAERHEKIAEHINFVSSRRVKKAA